ncbi:MAG: hypothetical protein JW776_12240 [Candidatus Lokiarchaeota archaeon]|nr:hypothetical protein [Candidatus Lokiarchaeota archaeon]
MSKFVVYISKSGNTKVIAEKIAQVAHYELISLNLMEKKGKGSSGEQAQEEARFMSAIRRCKNAELVFVGTPVIMKQPHPKIAKFVNSVDAKRMAFFITYENDMGFTLKEMKDSAEIRSIRVLGASEYGGLKTGILEQMMDKDKADILIKAEKFALDCLQSI